MNNLVSISIDDLISFRSFKNHFPDILQTPNIDRLMDMGVNFDSAFAQVAKCNQSRTSILTGLRPEETGVHDNNALWYESVSITKTLPYILAESGFSTSVIGKVFHDFGVSIPLISRSIHTPMILDGPRIIRRPRIPSKLGFSIFPKNFMATM